MGCKKKLYQYRPITDWTIETQRTKKRTRAEPCDPLSIQRGVRQLLADKVSGNLVGLLPWKEKMQEFLTADFRRCTQILCIHLRTSAKICG